MGICRWVLKEPRHAESHGASRRRVSRLLSWPRTFLVVPQIRLTVYCLPVATSQGFWRLVCVP